MGIVSFSQDSGMGFLDGRGEEIGIIIVEIRAVLVTEFVGEINIPIKVPGMKVGPIIDAITINRLAGDRIMSQKNKGKKQIKENIFFHLGKILLHFGV